MMPEFSAHKNISLLLALGEGSHKSLRGFTIFIFGAGDVNHISVLPSTEPAILNRCDGAHRYEAKGPQVCCESLREG
jgi:hypothetical protein